MAPPHEAFAELAAILRGGRGATGGAIVGDCTAIQAKVDAERPVGGPVVDELLLCRRMRALHLDPDELYCSEPWAFGVLRKLCATCEVQGRCSRDLADEFADPGWLDWRNYCPNATTLSILSALRECGPDGIDPTVRRR